MLDQKVNCDDLIYRYKGKNPGEEFDTYYNALDLINKVKNGEITLAGAKNDQKIIKSHLGEIEKGNNKKNRKSKKTQNTILKRFTKPGKRLLIFLTIILQ